MPDNEATVNININGAEELARGIGSLTDTLGITNDELAKVGELAETECSFTENGGSIDGDGQVAGADSSLLDGTDVAGKAEQLVEDVRDVAEESLGKIDEAVDEHVEKMSDASETVEDLGKSAKSAGDAMSETVDIIDGNDGLNSNLESTSDELKNLAQTSQDASKKIKDAADNAADGGGNDADDAADGATSALDRLTEGADTVTDMLSGTGGGKNPVSRVIDSLRSKMGGLGDAIGAEGAGGAIGALGKFAGVAGAVASALAIAGGVASEAIDAYQTARATSITQTGMDGDLLLGAREFADVQFRSMTSGLSEDEAKTIQAGLIDARLPFGSDGRGSYQEGMDFSQNAVLNYGLEANQAVELYTKAAIKNGRTIDEINDHLQGLLDVSKATKITVGELFDNYQKNAQKLESTYGDAGQDYSAQLDAMFGGTDEELREKYGDDKQGLNQVLNAKSFVAQQMGKINMLPGSLGEQYAAQYIKEGRGEGQAIAMSALRQLQETGSGSKEAQMFMQQPLVSDSKSIGEYILSDDYDGLEEALNKVKGGDDSGGWIWPSIEYVMGSMGMKVEGISDPHNVREYLETMFKAAGPNAEPARTNTQIQDENRANKESSAPLVDPGYDPGQDYLGLGYLSAHTPENFSHVNELMPKYVDVGGSKMDISKGSRGAELVQQYKDKGFSESEAIGRAAMSMRLQGVGGLSLPMISAKPGEKSLNEYILEGDYEGLEGALSGIKETGGDTWKAVEQSMSRLGIPQEVLNSPSGISEYIESVGSADSSVVGSGKTSTPDKKDAIDINIALSLEDDMGQVVTQKSIDYQWRQGLNDGND